MSFLCIPFPARRAGWWLRLVAGQEGEFPFHGVRGVLMRGLNQAMPALGASLELRTYLKG